jgi:hypothetical protein
VRIAKYTIYIDADKDEDFRRNLGDMETEKIVLQTEWNGTEDVG